MSAQQTIEGVISDLKTKHNFTDGSISLLKDKRLKLEHYQDLLFALNQPDESFAKWRESKSKWEQALDEGDSLEVTTGRNHRNVKSFHDISSEQALVKARMDFGTEYLIGLTDLVSEYPVYSKFVPRAFTDQEKDTLRSISKNFTTKDYYIARYVLEAVTNHDVVAANTWLTIQAMRKGMDDTLMRSAIHFARTSADVNTNMISMLFSRGVGEFLDSVGALVTDLSKYSVEYADWTGVGRTHGQKAQIGSVGAMFYGNIAEQIREHSEPFLQKDTFRFDGKIAGAIGTDVDFVSALPQIPRERVDEMYRHIVEDIYGLRYIRYGNDQDCTNAEFSRALDSLSNTSLVLQKLANDLWTNASRGLLMKELKEGESGSSIMGQKINPFDAEAAEALAAIARGEFNPIKENVVAYRGQGDLRRSQTMREAFHPVMLLKTSADRLRREINAYKPNVIALEAEVYSCGPAVISSAIQNMLRTAGMPDAYDVIKDVVTKPFITPREMRMQILDKMKGAGYDYQGYQVARWLDSVMDVHGFMDQLSKVDSSKWTLPGVGLIDQIRAYNSNPERKELVGEGINYANVQAERGLDTARMLRRYKFSLK